MSTHSYSALWSPSHCGNIAFHVFSTLRLCVPLHYHYHATGASTATAGETVPANSADVNAPLRAVTMEDFKHAMKKLKASVNDNGRELQKVVEWNNKYGEFKRKPGKGAGNKPAHMTMYV
jgi:hypothetical protein